MSRNEMSNPFLIQAWLFLGVTCNKQWASLKNSTTLAFGV